MPAKSKAHKAAELKARRLEEENAEQQQRLEDLQRQLDDHASAPPPPKKILVVTGNRRKKKTAASGAMTRLITTLVKTFFWGQAIFCTSHERLVQITTMLARNAALDEHTQIEEEEEREGAISEWVTLYNGEVKKALNVQRNYAQSQVRREMVDVHYTGLLQRSTPEAWGADPTFTQDDDGSLVAVPFLNSLDNLITADDILQCAIRNAGFLDTQKGKEIFDYYWDVLLLRAAGKEHWSPHFRHHNTISEARHDPSVTKPEGYPCIGVEMEAFVVLLFENCENKWQHIAVEKFNKPDDFQHDPKAAYARCAYTDHMTGDREWGGWNRAGRARFRAIRQMVSDGRKEETTKRIEKDALQRIRIVHNLEGENARVPGRRRRRRVRDEDETEGESDDDMAEL